MPSHDLPWRRGADNRLWSAEKLGRFLANAARLRKKRRGGPGNNDEPVPVEPNRPNTLTGGAAAALEFDD
ncbi:hypothetical protein EAH87_00435 [Sphingomonas koreensis]|nr:hypothetical protein EAH87_00435 [Sphingomonas koreensis]